MLLNLVANLELTEIGPVTGRVTEMLLAKLHSYNEVQNDGSEPSVEGLRPEAPHHPVDTKFWSHCHGGNLYLYHYHLQVLLHNDWILI